MIKYYSLIDKLTQKTYRFIRIPILLVLAFFGSEMGVFAASSNGTRLPGQGRVELGYEYLQLSMRTLDRSYGNLKSIDNFAILSLGITDWLAFDGKIGIGDLVRKGGIHLPKLEFNTGFAGGYGFRAKFFEHTQTRIKIILGAQHISVHPRDRSIDNDKFESFLDDWQISGIVFREFSHFSPYAGMKLSDCEFVYKINKHDKKRRYSLYHIGFIIGGDVFFLKDKMRLNVEARFFDESGISCALAYLF